MGLAEANAIDDGGVVQLVRDDGVFRSQQDLEQAGVGVETADVQNGVLAAMEAGNLLFQFFVNVL